jgi:twitching motility two-component system response regulator PilG
MRKVVMIVDDSMTVRKVVEVELSRAGYEVVAAPDGVEALRSLLVPDARLPELILVDIEMPRLDGYQFALRCQSREQPRLSHIPLVMLTRRAGIVDRLKARLAGARGYLTRPFKERELLALVASFIGPACADREDIPQPGQRAAGGSL